MTRYETYIDGKRENFGSLADAEEAMLAAGMEYADSRACDHPSEERRYYLPTGTLEQYPNADAAFDDLYGDGYEPCITPIED